MRCPWRLIAKWHSAPVAILTRMPNERADVVISGAGPNGLMLACELALAGVRPVVIDQLPGPSPEPKANGLVGQVVRLLDMRGLYRDFSGSYEPPAPLYEWIFAGMRVPLFGIEDNPMYAWMISQPDLVRRLNQRVGELGIDVRWGHEFTDLTAGADGVAVTVTSAEGVYTLETTFLVGADGGRSPVRKRVGIDFPGYTSDVVARLAHVRVPNEMRCPDGSLDVPGFGPLPFGHNRFDTGVFVFAPFEEDRQMIGTVEYTTGQRPDDSTPFTFDELRDSTRRVLGVEIPFEPPQGDGPHAMRRMSGQNTRQAVSYRAGHVFLLGDSAHVHSAMGGPGLNLGLQDALNLGWKLAATVNGWAPAGLLDTYQSERYPLGERVIMQSSAQTALMAAGPEVAGLRTLFGELLQIPAVAEHMARLLAGADVRYDVGDDHRLSGRLVPDLTLDDGRRVADLLHVARPVLLDLSGGVVSGAARGWARRVDAVAGTIAAEPACGILLRPDGYVAWAADEFGIADQDRLHTALHRWCGPAD
jgi:2-polyprenyl-6-methoxyphenol hydroxylase-like FAD-dependent oxidoreductase